MDGKRLISAKTELQMKLFPLLASTTRDDASAFSEADDSLRLFDVFGNEVHLQ